MWVVEVVVPIKKGIKCLVTVGVNYSLIKASFRGPLKAMVLVHKKSNALKKEKNS